MFVTINIPKIILKAHHDIGLTSRSQIYPILDKYFRQKNDKNATHT